MMRSGPRAAFVVSTFTSVHGLRFATAAWKIGAPGPGTWNVRYSSLASALANGVGPPIAELLVGQGDRTVPVRRVQQDRRGGLQGRERQRQDAAERRGIDRPGRRRQAANR